MAQNDPQSGVWTNPLPTSVSQDLEIIFESLSNWLANPTFQTGITVGNGTAPVYDPTTGTMTTPAPSTVVNLNSFTQAPSDTSAPGTPSVTAVGGIRSILAYWPAIQTANGSPVASYVAQVSTNNTFTAIVETLDPVGPVASFDNLTANTTYYVRVAAVSYKAVQGPWSATVTVTTPQVVAGDIAANTIIAGSAIIGSAAISSAQIASITANQITAGTINAQTIQLGATGGTAAIQSTNYVTGTTGWAILGDGSAEFSNVTINNGSVADSGTWVDGLGNTHTTTIKLATGDLTWNDNLNGLIAQFFPQVNAGTSPQAGAALVLQGGANIGAPGNYSTIDLGAKSMTLDATHTTLNDIEVNANTVTVNGTLQAFGSKGVCTSVDTNSVQIQAHNTSVTTNASGVATITFGTAFGTSALGVVANAANGSGAYWVAETVNLTTTSFQIVVVKAASTPLASTTLPINWIALGIH